MNITIFVGVLALLQFICLWVGNKASRNLQNQEAYFLANREVRFFPLFMTFVATQIGGGLILGSAEEAYQFGWTVLLYPLGACLGFVVLALGVGKKLAQFQVSTVAELFEVVYQSRILKKVASLLSIISLLMILVAQVIASRKFMLSLGLDHPTLFLAFWGIVIVYTVRGGLKAVVSIDIVQALFFIIVFIIGLGFILYDDSFSLPAVVRAGWNSPLFEFNTAKFSGWLLMPLLFMVIEQDMAQRCFAASSPRVVTQAAAASAVCTLVVCLIPVFIGILGKQAGVVMQPGSSVFMNVIQAFTSPAMSAFIGCAVMMAILSTAISLLNAVSSNLTQDFNLTSFKDVPSLLICQGITALIGVGAVIGSFYAKGIVTLLIQSYELSVYCLLVPVCAALFQRRGKAVAAWLAVILGGVGFWMSRSVEWGIPKEIVSLCLSGGGYLLGLGWIKWQAWMLSSEKSHLKI